MLHVTKCCCCITTVLLAGALAPHESRGAPVEGAAPRTIADETLLRPLHWRNIGPSRGGRVVAVAGVPHEPATYYMGATGGGVWKTENAGASWTNISDKFFKTGSVGAIAVAPSDANVIYAGMGEGCIRGNLSHGDGVYKSVDAGKTWVHVGLSDARQIGRIAVHPKDADLVYVAALGHVFGPNAERGVFRSRDGGRTWEKVLYVDDQTGAIDLSIDPINPRNLFAAMWEARRTPWSLTSGGTGSGLYRSRDGGDHWELLSKGLPKGLKGRIGVSASAAKRDLAYAAVEADDGGLFRSEDGGDSWKRVNEDRRLRQRAWYYTHVQADPREPGTVYVLNVEFLKSADGGKTFASIRVPHVDNHALWIAPEDNQRMINGNDGGANISFDGGATWSGQDNQPTAQFYHVTVDNQFPYRVYGAQQDNSTASISSRNRLGRWRYDFYSVGGGESGYIAVHPDDPMIVFAGSYGGYLTRYDHRMRKTRNIMIWPESAVGSGAAEVKYRFQWTFPIVISPHDPNTLYVGANALFQSRDQGETWEPISPDLTTNDKSKQQPSGGPITKDNTTVEYYCTVFTVAESPLKKGMIWVGSDDGLVHLTHDGGKSWKNVTPEVMGDWPLISMIEASRHDPDTAYLAVNRYKMDDFTPYVYRTTDAGANWTLVTSGLDRDSFVRVVREDPARKGLLYAGTETGVWYSMDDGESWAPLQQNLPRVPVTDLLVKDHDLVISTQGRSFWILDDVSTLRQLAQSVPRDDVHLFAPTEAHRVSWDPVRVHYYLPRALREDEELKLAFLNDSGEVAREFSSKPKKKEKEGAGEDDEEWGFRGARQTELVPAEAGVNAFEWHMRLEDPVKVPGAVTWPRTPPGPIVPPGRYAIRLTLGDRTLDQPFEIRKDPRVETTQDQFTEQFRFLMDVHEALNRTHKAVNHIRAMRAQIDGAVERSKHVSRHEALEKAAKELLQKLTEIEESLIQAKSKSAQDPLNYPPRLSSKFSALHYAASGDFSPTKQAREVFEELHKRLNEATGKLKATIESDISEFNRLVEHVGVPAVVPKLEEE